MDFNGRVVTVAGEPRTGPALLTFRFYADQAGGTALWGEQHAVTLDAQGRYAVILGTLTQGGLPSDVFVTGAARWLGVAVDADPEQPRFMLVSVAYALKAADADTVGGKAPADFVLTTNLTEQVKAAVNERSLFISSGNSSITAVSLNVLQKGDGAGGTTDSNVVDVGGFVGIGTAAPAVTLHLQSATTAQAFDRVSDNGASGSFLFRKARGSVGAETSVNSADTTMDFSAFGYDGASYRRTGQITSSVDGAPGPSNMPGRLAFWTTPSGSAGTVERMRIDNAGNVGIGTTNPSAKLHVGGNVTVDGNIGAKYQDVAEWVETSAPIEPATVVIVDPSQPNRVLPSAAAYDSRVAGAVSRQPGLVLGEASDTKAMVAQSGRVRVKVDATYGAIRLGDLLVTSPTAGYAMRSRPMRVGGQTMHRPGTILGKALEALPSGKGEILVLLTLQ
jgi:hypothetical protein